MELEAAKMIGAGLAAIALAGAGVGIGIIFGKISLESTKYRIPNVITSQNICENQNSGSSWGIPPLSADCIKFIDKKYTNKVLNITFFNIN